MSETIVEEDLVVEEEDVELEEDSKSTQQPAKPSRKKGKNPNRVKQGFKLAAIGQQAKEEKMRKRVQEEMIKRTTWITIGAVAASIGFLGLYFSPLFKNTETDEPVAQSSVKKEEPSKSKSRNYFE